MIVIMNQPKPYICIVYFWISIEKEFEKNKSEMMNFINGLVKTEKSKASTTIEYMSPSPPMETKSK